MPSEPFAHVFWKICVHPCQLVVYMLVLLLVGFSALLIPVSSSRMFMVTINILQVTYGPDISLSVVLYYTMESSHFMAEET